jgi:hypothetical protein
MTDAKTKGYIFPDHKRNEGYDSVEVDGTRINKVTKEDVENGKAEPTDLTAEQVERVKEFGLTLTVFGEPDEPDEPDEPTAAQVPPAPGKSTGS